MTRAPLPTAQPLVRIVAGDADCAEYVIALTTLGVTMRPKRARRDDASVFVPWSAVYRRALMARATASIKRGRVKPRRGVLRP